MARQQPRAGSASVTSACRWSWGSSRASGPPRSTAVARYSRPCPYAGDADMAMPAPGSRPIERTRFRGPARNVGMGKNTGFGGPVDPEVNCTMPPPLNMSTGGPGARVEASGSTWGTRPSLSPPAARWASAGGRMSGVPAGIAGSERQARTSGCSRITAGGSEVTAASSATPSGVLGSATAIGCSSPARCSRAAARQPRAIASTSSPDHRRPWAKTSGARSVVDMRGF